MLKNTLIIALAILAIYLYYQQRKNSLASFTTGDTAYAPSEIEEVKKVNKIFADFCKNEIGGQDINEIRAKLNGRTLAELLEENEDYETSVDKLKRSKGELEAEITSLTTAWKNRVGEKERIISRITQEKKDLETKYKKKAKLLDEEQCENNKFIEKITSLERQIGELQRTKSPMPGEFPKGALSTQDLSILQKVQEFQTIVEETEDNNIDRETMNEIEKLAEQITHSQVKTIVNQLITNSAYVLGHKNMLKKIESKEIELDQTKKEIREAKQTIQELNEKLIKLAQQD